MDNENINHKSKRSANDIREMRNWQNENVVMLSALKVDLTARKPTLNPSVLYGT